MWQLPKQWKDWCRAAGLKCRRGYGDQRRKSRWLYLHGHGREWRVNDKWEFQCGDTYADFDRWALCDIRSTPLPTNRAEFVAAVRALLLAHQSPAPEPDPTEKNRCWVRAWRCRNRRCLDGRTDIQVAHSINLRHHWCTCCGARCTFVRDVATA